MFDYSELEKKLKNRSSKNDLYDKGIIQNPNMDPLVYEQMNQIQKSSIQNLMCQKISTRPTKQDLVSRGILDGQDYETTSSIKRYISEHLLNRPGPLDVYQHLVAQQDNLTKDINNNPVSTPYAVAKKLLLCKTGALTHLSNDVVHHQRNKSNRRNGPKSKNITFHEFVPGKAGAYGYFIRSDNDKNRPLPNKFNYYDHYRQLVEQQALFLQMELEKKQQETNKENSCIQTAHAQRENTSYSNNYVNERDLGVSNNRFSQACSMDEINLDFLNQTLENFNCVYDIYEDRNRTDNIFYTNENSSSFFHDDDNFEDPYSSGYGTTSLQTSESYGIEPNYHLGFGLFHDCDSFNSVYEKIKMYEQLQTSSQHSRK